MLLYTSKGVTGSSHFRIRGRLPLRGMLVSAHTLCSQAIMAVSLVGHGLCLQPKPLRMGFSPVSASCPDPPVTPTPTPTPGSLSFSRRSRKRPEFGAHGMELTQLLRERPDPLVLKTAEPFFSCL